MPHRIAHAVETFGGILASLGIAGGFLLGQVDVGTSPQVIESAMELRLILMPLIGGVFTMLGGVFLNPSPEIAQIKVGRACFGMFVCVVSPQLIALAHPSLKEVGTKPILLLSIGGISAVLGFIFSRPVVELIYRRSAGISKQALDRLQSKYLPPSNPESKEPHP